MISAQTSHVDALVELVRMGTCSELDAYFARGLGRIGNEDRAQVLLVAALTYRATRDGHTCIPLKLLANVPGDGTLDMPWPDPAQLEQTLGTSALFGGDNAHTPFVLDRGRIYLRRYFALERAVAAHLRRRFAEVGDAVDPAWLASAFERLLDVKVTEEQRAAVERALQHNTTLISGGPGTGKTSSIVSALTIYTAHREQLGQRPPEVLLLAPTGKAAARLGRAAPRYETSTIHRALGARKGGKSFRYDADRPLVADIVVVDEASMVDLALMHALLEALPAYAKLVLVGDPHQLASVETGSVFADICAAAKERPELPATSLTTQHRYAQSSGIAELAHAVREGNADAASSVLSDSSCDKVELLPPSSIDEVIEKTRKNFGAILRCDTREAALTTLAHSQVLCVHRNGPFSTRTFNDQVVRPFDELVPIIIERNRHELDLYNGDVGLLDRRASEAFFLDASGKTRRIAQSLLPAHDLAFAITVHKSQGSEFSDVTLILPPHDAPLLTRELLYTGLTRAKHRVTIVGSREALSSAIANEGTRHTGLKDALLCAG